MAQNRVKNSVEIFEALWSTFREKGFDSLLVPEPRGLRVLSLCIPVLAAILSHHRIVRGKTGAPLAQRRRGVRTANVAMSDVMIPGSSQGSGQCRRGIRSILPCRGVRRAGRRGRGGQVILFLGRPVTAAKLAAKPGLGFSVSNGRGPPTKPLRSSSRLRKQSSMLRSKSFRSSAGQVRSTVSSAEGIVQRCQQRRSRQL